MKNAWDTFIDDFNFAITSFVEIYRRKHCRNEFLFHEPGFVVKKLYRTPTNMQYDCRMCGHQVLYGGVKKRYMWALNKSVTRIGQR